MATQLHPETLNLQEQIARIAQIQEDIDRTRAEAHKAQAEVDRVLAETRKAHAEIEFMPRIMIFQAMLATAALLGAGAAIAKLFFP